MHSELAKRFKCLIDKNKQLFCYYKNAYDINIVIKCNGLKECLELYVFAKNLRLEIDESINFNHLTTSVVRFKFCNSNWVLTYDYSIFYKGPYRYDENHSYTYENFKKIIKKDDILYDLLINGLNNKFKEMLARQHNVIYFDKFNNPVVSIRCENIIDKRALYSLFNLLGFVIKQNSSFTYLNVDMFDIELIKDTPRINYKRCKDNEFKRNRKDNLIDFSQFINILKKDEDFYILYAKGIMDAITRKLGEQIYEKRFSK